MVRPRHRLEEKEKQGVQRRNVIEEMVLPLEEATYQVLNAVVVVSRATISLHASQGNLCKSTARRRIAFLRAYPNWICCSCSTCSGCMAEEAYTEMKPKKPNNKERVEKMHEAQRKELIDMGKF
jgi:hypothetical protein